MAFRKFPRNNLSIFVLPSLGVFPVILILDLNDSESCIVLAGSSL